MTKDRNRFIKYLEKFEGKEVQIKVQKPKSIRSLNQNNYYFGVIVKEVREAMKEIVPAKTHAFLAAMFLSVGMEFKGKRYNITRSTANLSVAEFEDYLENIRRWASVELSLSIPLPNEIDWDEVILRTTA